MKENVLRPWQEKIIIYMLLIMAGNPMIMLYKSLIYTIYKILFLVIVSILFLKYKDIWMRIKVEKLKVFAVFIGLITFSVIMNTDKAGVTTLVSYYVFITLGMLVSELILPQNFQVRFVQVMFIVCLVSLLFFGLLLAKPVILNKLLWTTVHANEMNAYRSNILYNAIIDKRFTSVDGSAVSMLDRNCGPFWEPGVFQCFISMGLVCLIENRKREKYFQIKLIIFLITLVSTVSVVGVISLAVIIIWYTLKNVKLFAVYIAIGVLGAGIIGLQIFDYIFSRITDISSFYILARRAGLLVLTFENIVKSMLWGQSFVEGSYNGYITLFLRFGTIFLIIWLRCLYKGSKAIAGGMFFVAVMIGLTSEPIAYSTIFWLIVFYSIDLKGKTERSILCRKEKLV